MYTYCADLVDDSQIFRRSVWNTLFDPDVSTTSNKSGLVGPTKMSEDETIRILKFFPDLEIHMEIHTHNFYNYKRSTSVITFNRIVVDNQINLLLAF